MQNGVLTFVFLAVASHACSPFSYCVAIASAHPQAILASPMGVVRLMDLLMEREVVRNEALLLLIGLSRASVDIQKIAAFEGAFDRLLTIIRWLRWPFRNGIVV